MEAATVQRQPIDKAARAAAPAAPKPLLPLALATGATAGLPLFMRPATGAGSAAPPPGRAPSVQRLCRECADEADAAKAWRTGLTIGPADDPLEREADAVAARVQSLSPLRGAAPAGEGRQEKRSVPGSSAAVRRLCSSCSGQLPDEQLLTLAPQRVQRKAEGESALPAPDAVAAAIHSPAGGTPLPGAFRWRAETVLGLDLGGVRVHQDPASEAAAMSINARAFTHGEHIYLGRGQSAHETHLMAHEAAHVAQQSGASPAAKGIQRLPGDEEEGFWSSAAQGVVAGGRTLLGYGEAGARAVGEGVGSLVEAGGQAVSAAGGMARDAAIGFLEERAPGALAFFRGLRDFVAEGVSAGFDSLFPGVAASYEEGGLGGALEYIFVDLAGGAVRGIGSFAAGTCAAVGEAAQWLLDAGARLGGEAIAAVSAGATAVAGFLNGLWERFGAPAAEAIRGFIGGIWESITETVSGWWERLEPVRTAVAEAWDWLVGTILGGMRSLNDLLTEVFAWAVEKWNKLRGQLLPFMGYAKALAVVLLLLSPMGPFVAAGAAIYGLYRLVLYLWQAWGRPLTAEIRQLLVDEVLPAIMDGLALVEEKIGAAGQWLAGLAGQLASFGVALLDAIGGLPVLRLAQRTIAGIQRQLQRFGDRVGELVGQFVATLGQFLRSAWQFLQPILEFLRQIVLVGLFGPLAILDDGVWTSVNRIAAFAMSVPCVRELAGLMQLPAILDYAGRFRAMMQSAWRIVENPEPIWQALHDALAPMVASVPGIVAETMARMIYPHEQEHRRGVEAHLLPAVDHLMSDWWGELKKMGWTLLWPWDEVAERFPLLLQHGREAITHLFDLEIGDAIDSALLMVQDVNTVLGAVWGWFALAAVLIGGVLGAFGVAFSGGTSIGAGMAAGWALAEQVGIGLLVSVAATEMAIIGKAMFDIRFTNAIIEDDERRADANDGDYRNIANSTFTLAVVTALMVLGALAGKLASSIWGKVRGLRARARGAGEAAPGEAPAGGRPAEPAPAELARTNDLLRQRVRDPNNVRSVSDPELSARYDAEVRVGDHVYRRSRSNRTWCRFSTRRCGIDLGDVNARVDAALPKAQGGPGGSDLGTRASGRPRATPEPDPTPPSAAEVARARALGDAKPPRFTRLGDVWRWLRYRAAKGRKGFSEWLESSRGSRSGGPNHQAIQDRLLANGGDPEVPIGSNAADARWPQGTNGAARDTYHQIGELNEVRGDPINRERVNFEDMFNHFRRRGQDVEFWFWDRNNPGATEPVFRARTNRPLNEQLPAGWERAVRKR